MTRTKQFRLTAGQIEPLAPGRGACIATDMITVDGHPVRYMFRTAPRMAGDSGWAFFSGLEPDAYLRDSANMTVFDVNTIANYDPSIVPLLDAPAGSAFSKPEGSDRFLPVPEKKPG
jgi:hypothetical protein